VIGAALAGAIGIALAPIPPQWRVRVPSAVLLAASALIMGARALAAPSLAASEALSLGAALGAIAIAAVLVETSGAAKSHRMTTALAAAGVALAVAVVLVRSDGGVGRTIATMLAAGLTGVAMGPLLRPRRWRGFASAVAIGAAVIALTGGGIRFAVTVSQPGFEADFWLLMAALISVSIAIAAIRAGRAKRVVRATGALLAVLWPVLAAGELVLVGSSDILVGIPGTADAGRTGITVTALVAITVAGAALRHRLGLASAISSGITAVAFALAATLAFGVRPIEIATLPIALGWLLCGASVMRHRPTTRSWPALGPGIALLTVPSLAYDASTDPILVRVVALGIVAVALVTVGALMRLQAPLVIGSIVVLIHALAQLWPWIAGSYVEVPWWLWLGIGGALLIYVAATYERSVRRMRTAFTAVASLR
jgi:trimeric autotransporter adhesin